MPDTATDYIDPRQIGPVPDAVQMPGEQPQTPQQPPQPMSPADVQGFVKKSQDVTDESVNRIRGLDKQRMDLASTPTPHPAQPQFQDIPKPPDTKPLNVFKEAQPALIFATVMGAAVSRKSGIGAMAAATGFLEGWQKGDQERMDRERQKWNDNVTAIKDENAVAKSRYDAVWNDTQLSMTDKTAKINAIAASIGDEKVINALQNGQLDFAYKAPQDVYNAAQKLWETNVKFGMGGSPSQQAFRRFQNETIERRGRPPTSDEIVDWEQKQRPARSAVAMAMQQARKENPDWTAKQIVDFGANAAAYMAAQRTLAVRGANISVGGQELINFAGPALAASELIDRGQWVPINKLNQDVRRLQSDPDLRELSNRTAAMITAYAQVISRNGGITVHAQERAADLLNTAESREAYERGVQTLINEADLAEKAPDEARQKLHDLFMGGSSTSSRPSDTAATRPVKVQTPAEAEKLSPGTKYITPDGQSFTR